MDYMDPNVQKKAIKLNHSLTQSEILWVIDLLFNQHIVGKLAGFKYYQTVHC